LLEKSFSQQRQYKADTEQSMQTLKRTMEEASSAYEQRRSILRAQQSDAKSDLAISEGN